MSTDERPLVLVIEDDEASRDAIAGVLQFGGYDVTTASSGEQALAYVEADGVDLVVLDLMMPGTGGYEVLRRLREREDMPVIILSGLTATEHKVQGLRLGADDYLEKPFDAEELLARVDARLRRARTTKMLVVGDLRLNLDTREVFFNSEPVTLTRRQFDVLALFASAPGKAFSREEILERVWGTRFVSPRNVNEQIRLIRVRLKAVGLDKDVFEAAPGLGYRFRP